MDPEESMSVKRGVKTSERSFSHPESFSHLPVKSVKSGVKSEKQLFTPKSLILCGFRGFNMYCPNSVSVLV